mmetsp:Transcript_14449/g.37482  ORF Transcript_14449/g.37482 Transcript_14449/m.37482 type:complete len:531 (+) Transcript_14449:1183-2775(+)
MQQAESPTKNMETDAEKKSETNSTSGGESPVRGTGGRKSMEVSACGSAVEEVAIVYRADEDAAWAAYKMHGAAQYYDELMAAALEEKDMPTSTLKFAGKELGIKVLSKPQTAEELMAVKENAVVFALNADGAKSGVLVDPEEVDIASLMYELAAVRLCEGNETLDVSGAFRIELTPSKYDREKGFGKIYISTPVMDAKAVVDAFGRLAASPYGAPKHFLIQQAGSGAKLAVTSKGQICAHWKNCQMMDKMEVYIYGFPKSAYPLRVTEFVQKVAESDKVKIEQSDRAYMAMREFKYMTFRVQLEVPLQFAVEVHTKIKRAGDEAQSGAVYNINGAHEASISEDYMQAENIFTKVHKRKLNEGGAPGKELVKSLEKMQAKLDDKEEAHREDMRNLMEAVSRIEQKQDSIPHEVAMEMASAFRTQTVMLIQAAMASQQPNATQQVALTPIRGKSVKKHLHLEHTPQGTSLAMADLADVLNAAEEEPFVDCVEGPEGEEEYKAFDEGGEAADNVDEAAEQPIEAEVSEDDESP